MGDRIDLTTSYMGLTLDNPIIVGSSGLTQSLEGVQHCARAGAGAVVLKSIFEEQILSETTGMVRDSSDSLWHPEAAEYITTYGRENAVGDYIKLITEAKKHVTIPIIASINCVSSSNWMDYAKKIQDAGADGLELNVFWLPTKLRTSSAENEKLYFELIKLVRQHLTIPIAMKMSYYFSSLADHLVRLSTQDIQALVLFNRYYQPDFDIENLTLLPAPMFSSPEEIARPLRWISLLSDKVECDLAGTTGVHDASGLIKILLAGAKASHIVSTLYKNGLDQIAEIRRGLESWMERHEFSTIGDFRGKMSQAASLDPAAYERVQFMKLSIGLEQRDKFY